MGSEMCIRDRIYTGHIDKCHVVLCDPSDDIDKFNIHAKENGMDTLKKYVPIDVCLLKGVKVASSN